MHWTSSWYSPLFYTCTMRWCSCFRMVFTWLANSQGWFVVALHYCEKKVTILNDNGQENSYWSIIWFVWEYSTLTLGCQALYFPHKRHEWSITITHNNYLLTLGCFRGGLQQPPKPPPYVCPWHERLWTQPFSASYLSVGTPHWLTHCSHVEPRGCHHASQDSNTIALYFCCTTAVCMLSSVPMHGGCNWLYPSDYWVLVLYKV